MNNKLRDQYCLEKGGINPSNIIEWYYIEWLENKLIEQPSVVSDEEIKDKANEQPDNYEQALPIRDVSSRFNLVADVMPARNEYVLIKTPYCKYPATVGFWNGVKWLAADDKCEIFNVSEWLSLNGC